MKGQRLIIALMALAIFWLPAANASTQPFDENSKVEVKQAASEDPFQVQTSIPAIVKEVEEINKEIEKLFDDEKETTEEKVEAVKKVVKHTVVAGDSLWAIAQKLLGDGSRYRELIEANKGKYPSLEKNPELIYSGWVLDVPQDASTAEAPTTESATETSTETEEQAPTTSVDNNSSSSTTQVSQIPQWSTKQKVAKLQSTVDSANRKLLAQKKRIGALNSQTIRFLIDNGFMTEEEWMAMNPPAGYTYRIDKLGKIELVDSKNQPLTNEEIAKIDSNQAKATEATNKAADNGTFLDKVSDILDKTKETAEVVESVADDVKKALEKDGTDSKPKASEEAKPKESEAKAKAAEEAKKKAEEDSAKIEAEAKKAANERYFKMLAEIGVPDVSDNKNYWNAVSAGSKFLSKGVFSGTTAFYKFVNSQDFPSYNIRDLQKELMALQSDYEELVRKNKTNRFLGIFGSTIESTGKKIAAVKDKLKKAWTEMQKALNEAKAKANELNGTINTEKDKITALQKELDKLDIYDSANYSEVQGKMKAINESKEAIEDAQEKLEYYDKLKKVFK